MKSISIIIPLIFLLFTLLFQSCDDGDIIVTTFNFENVALKTCGDVGNYVFYKENSQEFESLSLRLGTTDSIYKTADTLIYDLASNINYVNYRSYNGPLGNNYFCSSIPPTSPTVEVDYLAVSGRAEIIVTFVEINPVNKESDKAGLNHSQQNRGTIQKSVQVILKDVVLVSGDDQITQETLNMGRIENVRTEEINP